MVERWYRFVERDSIFIRVVLFIAGASFAALLVWCLFQSDLKGPPWWLAAALVACLGGILPGFPLLATDQAIDKWSDLFGDGSDLFSVIVLLTFAIAAVPVTVLIRAVVYLSGGPSNNRVKTDRATPGRLREGRSACLGE